MQHGKSLANLAIILVLSIIFFMILTQRMMVSSNMSGSFSTTPPVNSHSHTTETELKLLSEIARLNLEVFQLKQQLNNSVIENESTAHLRTQPSIETPEVATNNRNIHFHDSLPTPADVIKLIPKVIESDKNLNEVELDPNNHPQISPREGSDISIQQHTTLLLCINQSRCIVPELQLQKKYKIYLCKHPHDGGGIRFHYLITEGLHRHPNVELITQENINNADYYIYLPGSSPWHITECLDPKFATRMIVLDEFDGENLNTPPKLPPNSIWYTMYFKRSFVNRDDGVFKGYPHLSRPAYPMTYTVAEKYLPHIFNQKREIEISCTLRGSKEMSTRLRVQQWVAEYGRVRNVKNIIAGEINSLTRGQISLQYFEMMYNSQIIVTVNPADWEGDFRLWEAMGSGALVFVDPLFVPHPFPLLDGVHVAYFSNNNKTELFEKLDYYRSHPIERARVATQGYLHALKYHRTVNLVDYILRSVHLQEALKMKVNDSSVVVPKYSYTAQYLNLEAAKQEQMIKDCQTPGIYEDPLHFNTTGEVKRLQCIKKITQGSSTSNIAFINRL